MPALVAQGKTVFVTGRAGSGKTATLVATLAALEAAGTCYVSTASTGIAAVPLSGTTLHSQLCLFEDKDLKMCVRMAKGTKPILKRVQVLVIDEISMTSAQTMQRAYDILCAVRGGPNLLPAVIMVGDFFQLPPVKGDWVFTSDVWKSLAPVIVDLPQSFRQQGLDAAAFLQTLDEIRVGELTRSGLALLRTRIGTTMGPECAVKPTVLMSRRAAVADINAVEMAKLVSNTNPVQTYVAVIDKQHQLKEEGTWIRREGSVLVDGATLAPNLAGARVYLPPDKEEGELHARDSICKLFGHVLTPCVLELCLGAQVMFTANVDPPIIVNGTRGMVVAIDPATTYPHVQLVSGVVVHVHPFRATRPIGNRKVSPAYVFEQVPLMPAWALTIHKSQGMSLDLVEVDLGPSVWEKGQAYVALSRARTLAGLTIRALTPASVRADATVVEWHKSLACKGPAEI